MPVSDAAVRCDGDALVFTGALTRDGVAALWRDASTALAESDLGRFDLTAVTTIDSAGLALLSELAAQTDGIEISGDPSGLAELRSAYRLSANLGYAG